MGDRFWILSCWRCTFRETGSICLLNLVYAAPSPTLADYVSAFYLFDTDEPSFSDIERADIAQLRFSLSGSGDITFGPNDTQPFSAVTLIGPRMKASTLRVTGPAICFGMGLLPAGWCALTGLPANQYANRVVDAQDRINGDVFALREAMAASGCFEDMVAASERFVAEAVAKAETPPFRLIRAVDAWLEASMDPDIGDLAEKTGLSAAQLQRQLKATYGASPKLLARKYRALKTAVRIANGDGVWQDYVGDTYYDQSHCIREIKAFTGVTPEAIRKTPRLTKATFERHKLKGKISTLATEI
ncbi:MAG: hypothetical protein RIQ75_1613 [Pseudomonadota bacterium]